MIIYKLLSFIVDVTSPQTLNSYKRDEIKKYNIKKNL